MRRLLTGAALGVAFIVMASVFDPGRTVARDISDSVDESGFPSTDPHEGLLSLGELSRGQLALRMYSTEDGLRYSVFNERGRALASLRTAAQIQDEFPQFQILTLDADTPVESGFVWDAF